MSDAVYERYKEALRRGHVAAAHDRHEVALAAYADAAALAPERAMPHTGIGTAYLALDRPAEALTAFDLALERAPGDETSLAGRADALASLGQAAEAAATLDRLSAAQDAEGRAIDALTSASRALELAESRSRRSAVKALVDRVRAIGGTAGAETLERAVALVELPEPEAPPQDPFVLAFEADAALDEGDTATAHARLLAAGRSYRVFGHPNAALDACYAALELEPADAEVHLTLAELYLDRGWGDHLTEKLRLLARLADLDADVATVERVRALSGRSAGDGPSAEPVT
jgi:tetratricopeptide (TPR) repeat protein